MSAKIIISRKSEWLNRMRPYKVMVDETEAGIVKNDSSEEFIVADGVHQVYLKCGFYRSETITLNVSEQNKTYLLVKSSMKYFWPLYILLIAGILINLFFRESKVNGPAWLPVVQSVLVAPCLLYFLYYLTLGRKKYLELSVDKDNIFNV